eukprot:CAMPEP_0172151232 /NCGR_PEP_ID=MMETSP1050-20130122/106_1 /TAXON_ID=233186 /ORGANISM="Cryptomonas curvata, Strain CCAP979/52" /LENGTH=210 /DNA_ID=CAMNT_0012819297 /DNA_START=13 /DNA_END=645 /DNA_ORIENTATION=+
MKCASNHKAASPRCTIAEELRRIDVLLEHVHGREPMIERARSGHSEYDFSLNDTVIHKTTPSYKHQPISCAHGVMQKQLPAPSKALVHREQQAQFKAENPPTESDYKNNYSNGSNKQTIQEKRMIDSPPKSSMKKKPQQAMKTEQSNQDRHVRFELTESITCAVDMHLASTSYTRKLLKSVSKFLIRLAGTASLKNRMGKKIQARADPIY